MSTLLWKAAPICTNALDISCNSPPLRFHFVLLWIAYLCCHFYSLISALQNVVYARRLFCSQFWILIISPSCLPRLFSPLRCAEGEAIQLFFTPIWGKLISMSICRHSFEPALPGKCIPESIGLMWRPISQKSHYSKVLLFPLWTDPKCDRGWRFWRLVWLVGLQP